MKIANNSLLLILLGFMSLYWLFGWYIPNLLLSGTVSIFSVLIGIAVIYRYSIGVYRVLWKGERSDRGDGAHLAALGIPALAAGVVYGGAFNLIWTWMGNPETWIGTPMSNFGRVLQAIGFVGLFFSPDASRHRVSLSGAVWAISILMTAVIVAFLMGARLAGGEMAPIRRFIYGVHYPVCPADQPVIGTTTKVYHDEASPYRDLIKPRTCFATVKEAEKAGFRPPRLNFPAPRT